MTIYLAIFSRKKNLIIMHSRCFKIAARKLMSDFSSIKRYRLIQTLKRPNIYKEFFIEDKTRSLETRLFFWKKVWEWKNEDQKVERYQFEGETYQDKKLEDKTFEGELFALESLLTSKEKSVVRQLHILVVFWSLFRLNWPAKRVVRVLLYFRSSSVGAKPSPPPPHPPSQP